MATPIEMVHGTGTTTLEEDNSWRYGEQHGGVVSVTIVPDLFNTDDATLRDKYLTGLGPNATTIYIRSGIPLAQITDGDNKGAYGPYDPDATDGRQTAIAGLLESMVAVNITYTGWDVDDVYVGMRYRGDIIKSNLPAIPPDDATWEGDFYDVEDDKVSALSATAATGTPGAGKVTPAQLAGYTAAANGKVPQSNEDGSAFDFTGTTPLPATGAAIADLAADADTAATVATVNKALAALRAWGVIAAK